MSEARWTPVSSVDDPRIRVYADLRHRASRRDAPHFIAEGRLVVHSLLRSGHVVESLLVEAGREEQFAPRVPETVPIYSLAPDLIRKLVGFDFHRGIMACGRRPASRPISELSLDRDDAPIALAAIGVSEAGNLGSMLRTAAAFGIDQILIGPGTFDPFGRRVIRTSMAAVFRQKLYRLDEPVKQLPQIARRLAARTVATSLRENATSIDAFETDNQRLLLIVGGEAEGLSDEILAACTDRLRIPMRLGIDSLNVSVATAIFLYELTQTR